MSEYLRVAHRLAGEVARDRADGRINYSLDIGDEPLRSNYCEYPDFSFWKCFMKPLRTRVARSPHSDRHPWNTHDAE